MARSLWQGYRGLGSVAASTTLYRAIGISQVGAAVSPTTEAFCATPLRQAGVFSRFYWIVVSNDRGTSTARFRVNSGNGNQVVSITASTTGQFQDTTNKDTVAAALTVETSLVTGAGGTVFVELVQSVVFDSASAYTQYSTQHSANYTVASTTYYSPLSQCQTAQSTENLTQLTMAAGGTLKNGFAYVSATRAVACTIRSRVNTANGNIVVTLTGSAVGLFEDTTNTDTLAVNDLVNMSLTTGTGVDTLTVQWAGVSISTTNAEQLLSAALSGTAIAASATVYSALGGNCAATATESNVRADLMLSASLSNLACFISANTIVGAGTLRSRINGANGNLSISLTGLTTGRFVNTASTDLVDLDTTEVNAQWVGGAAGTSMTVNLLSILATPLSGMGASTIPIRGIVRTGRKAA